MNPYSSDSIPPRLSSDASSDGMAVNIEETLTVHRAMDEQDDTPSPAGAGILPLNPEEQQVFAAREWENNTNGRADDTSIIEDDLVANSDETIPSKRTLNGTAYRIFKMLQWLMEQPLTFQELNARFTQDPIIGKAVSNDSVWLYINTLKQLGCQFKRPAPKNNFCYELKSHPFGLSLSDGHQDTLIMVKAFAQKCFDHSEMLALDHLFKKIIRYSSVAMPERCIETLFSESRSFDFGSSSGYIQLLEQGVRDELLFKVNYRSPLQGNVLFEFIPETLYYEHGVAYVRGERADKNLPSSLRIDKILSLDLICDEPLRRLLLLRRDQKIKVHLRVLLPNEDPWPGFGLEAHHGVYQETRLKIENRDGKTCVDVELLVRDFFYLKQKLLSSRVALEVVSPMSLKLEFEKTLQAMLSRYEELLSKSSTAQSEAQPEAQNV